MSSLRKSQSTQPAVTLESNLKAFLKGAERERKLALMAPIMPAVLETMARCGHDPDAVDLKLALGEMFRRGQFAEKNRQIDKARARLPKDAPFSAVAQALGITLRNDRSLYRPGATAKIRDALCNGKFPSVRALARRAFIDESALRKVLKNSRATLETWRKLARAIGTTPQALFEQ